MTARDEAFSRLATENTALRVLALMLVPELQRPALMPGEQPARRLEYLLAQVTPEQHRAYHDGTRWHGARALR